MDKLVYLKGENEISEDDCKTRRDKYLTFTKDAEKTLADALINLVQAVADQQTADIGLHDILKNDMLREWQECNKN